MPASAIAPSPALDAPVPEADRRLAEGFVSALEDFTGNLAVKVEARVRAAHHYGLLIGFVAGMTITGLIFLACGYKV